MEANTKTRRDFIRMLAIGGGGMILIGKYRFLFAQQPVDGVLKTIVVDYDKCAGCKTCETVCSAFHYTQVLNGETLNGLGNPKHGNIRVYHFNPDVDIPTVCANCPDTPCVNACPSSPDETTGYGAIYRDKQTLAIRTNHELCLQCGSCSRACEKDGAGIIKMNTENFPGHICDHCGGDPQCVKYCPYGALAFYEVDVNGEYFAKSSEEIARKLFDKYYAN